MPKLLDRYFPGAPHQHEVSLTPRGFAAHPENQLEGGEKHANTEDSIPTVWRVALTLELQGTPKKIIAEKLGITYGGLCHILHDERYRAFRDNYLVEIDQEFLAMKPLAFDALRQGLKSPDEDTALKASDQWFRAAGFGGYSKREEPARQTTAEDVVRQLLNVSAENVQINVNVGSDD
jgi:hypothetical protein